LVILDRPENAGAEQTVALGLEGAVVDRLGLFDLAVRPGQNLFRARDRNPNLVEDLSRHLRAEKIHKLLVHRSLRFRRQMTDDRQKIAWFTVLCPPSSIPCYSAASATSPPPRCCLELCRSTLRPSERISFTSTLKDSGMPDSKASSPRTIDS